MKRILALSLVAISLILPRGAEGKLGVGSGRVEIVLKQPVEVGQRVYLGQIPIFNTGDEQADYNFFVTYEEAQTLKKPDASWFSFDPQPLNLFPNTQRPVVVYMTVPQDAEAGQYFAYLEARPYRENSLVSIAAATKLRFEVVPQTQPVSVMTVSLKKVGPLLFLFTVVLAGGIYFFVRLRKTKGKERLLFKNPRGVSRKS